MFITLDGIDGAGKSTQIRMLCEHLRAGGRSVTSLRDPGSTPPGDAVRSLLLDSDLQMHRRTEALLYMAARCELVEQRIRPALEAGQWVVCDRFLLANVVYQSVGGKERPERLWHLGELATDGLKPDLTILLDLPAEEAFERLTGPADRMESRGVEYLEAVRGAFRAQLPHSSRETLVVDARQPIQQVHEVICAHLQPLLSTEG
ncbi:dTMP kinase [Roseimaritima sediminicola]|uniref:dTMP kinase n=1 Tax=Roseimaritima sediminicola TaxID=2662066 RepID=UPI0012983131|nr:dTMP kinase [Roseimaritima sediminicola]